MKGYCAAFEDNASNGATASVYGGLTRSGTSKQLRGGNSDWCHRILWNFYEATSLLLQGIGVQGSLLPDKP